MESPFVTRLINEGVNADLAGSAWRQHLARTNYLTTDSDHQAESLKQMLAYLRLDPDAYLQKLQLEKRAQARIAGQAMARRRSGPLMY